MTATEGGAQPRPGPIGGPAGTVGAADPTAAPASASGTVAAPAGIDAGGRPGTGEARTGPLPSDGALAGPPLLTASGLRVRFPAGRGRSLVAVDGVDLTLRQGEILGLVGESGCGKTTVARVLAGLQAATEGTVELDGRALLGRRAASDRRAIQMVFQDPTSSLNPRMTVGTMLRQLLATLGQRGEASRRRTVDLLGRVGLPASTTDRYPRELSGGQRQRVAIARALAVEPRVIVADEPTSALDVSVQATILQLFAELRTDLGLGLVLISHNLAATRALCDRTDVMYLGRIVERGSRPAVFGRPAHPYTRALLASAPSLASDTHTEADADTGSQGRAVADADAGARAATDLAAPGAGTEGPAGPLPPPGSTDRVVAGRLRLRGEPPSATRIPSGCRLHPRCPQAQDRCRDEDPHLLPVRDDPGHFAACHYRDLEEPAP